MTLAEAGRVAVLARPVGLARVAPVCLPEIAPAGAITLVVKRVARARAAPPRVGRRRAAQANTVARAAMERADHQAPSMCGRSALVCRDADLRVRLRDQQLLRARQSRVPMRLRLSNAGVKATWASGCRPNTGAEGGIAGADHAVAVTFRVGFAWPSDANRIDASEVLRAGARRCRHLHGSDRPYRKPRRWGRSPRCTRLRSCPSGKRRRRGAHRSHVETEGRNGSFCDWSCELAAPCPQLRN
jgi:hypothetical protein